MDNNENKNINETNNNELNTKYININEINRNNEDINNNDNKYNENQANDNKDNAIINELYNRIFELYLYLKLDKDNSQKDEINNKKYVILNKVIQNICENPTKENYRLLKISNKNIKLIYDDKNIIDFLLFIGFEEVFIEESCLIFDNENLNMLNLIINQFCMLETSFDGKLNIKINNNIIIILNKLNII